MPRLRQLRQFIAIAEERNFRRAAERLHMTQPPLTQSMHLLEDELGVSLMERDRRGVTLTTAGSVFLAECRLVLAQMDRAVAVTRGTAQGMTGRIVVGFGHSTTFYLVPETLRRFAVAYPNVDLVLEELNTVEQVDALSDGRIDIGLLRPPVVGGDDLAYEGVLRERLVAILPANHEFAHRDRIALRDLRHERFIIGEPRWSTGYHGRILKACEEAGFVPTVKQGAIHTQGIVTIVAAGLGVTIGPATLRYHSVRGVTYLDLEDDRPDLRLDLGLAWRNANDSAMLQAFREIVRTVSQGMDPAVAEPLA